MAIQYAVSIRLNFTSFSAVDISLFYFRSDVKVMHCVLDFHAFFNCICSMVLKFVLCCLLRCDGNEHSPFLSTQLLKLSHG